ncbi:MULTISPECIES: hypothetical protein [unclassified Paracoccus (in: a-proteobacteria)]|uniref:hypothetical protein n=1 Tax=unclassified Paracoccus (in: a-proteobacteria) TaxID=2688777 RepID=UPI0012B2ED73|nr:MULTISPECIES: hypothetical protein [unclassified Paracoccus (in: a-proteobacteria)]UXU73804.1 hypothetical protein GB879_007595 [Paracoccus sp. SMMA_5]UXU79694.1 hypothetical protein GB880_007585 [Paracoccus sp. SMMA_5_TC]
MAILERIRAHGGEVIRDKWTITLRKGRLTPAALAWVKDHRDDLMREVWPEFDDFEERAAIREFEGGMSRADAEAAAYAEVMDA